MGDVAVYLRTQLAPRDRVPEACLAGFVQGVAEALRAGIRPSQNHLIFLTTAGDHAASGRQTKLLQGTDCTLSVVRLAVGADLHEAVANADRNGNTTLRRRSSSLAGNNSANRSGEESTVNPFAVSSGRVAGLADMTPATVTRWGDR